MHLSTLIAATFAVGPAIVSAHGPIPGAPRLFGRRSLADLEARIENGGVGKKPVPPHVPRSGEIVARQGGAEGQCGQGLPPCAAGYCCSESGWCGQGGDYCAAPGCQSLYGPACDDNAIPQGANTSTVARPKLGSVPYGTGIYPCTVPGTIAITYDDGPYVYTDHVLDLFASYGAKATFFITANNNGKGQIDNEATPWPAVIRRMYNEGHQLASHTWSHGDLSAMTGPQRRNQMWKLEMAVRNIVGRFPTYMRPPYSSCNAACEQDMADLGYHITYFDLDTDDYNNLSPELIQNAKNNFDNKVNPSNPVNDEWLAIAHDIHEQTAYNLTAHMLDVLTAKGYRAVTVGECLDDPPANWYRSSSGGTFTSTGGTSAPTTSTSSAPGTSPTAVSPDGTCGGNTGFTCIGSGVGNCCSQHGWCGTTDGHCGTGCQSAFGLCGAGAGTSSVRPSSTTSAAPTSPTASRTSSAAAPTGTSTDGTCGGTAGRTCLGTSYGNCCSQYGWCGTTDGHCGTGCQSAFGLCGAGAGTSSVRPSSTTTRASSTTSTRTSSAPGTSGTSTNGLCGGSTRRTCLGSAFGNCCSQYGWCGSSTTHCGQGCQPAFGTCS